MKVQLNATAVLALVAVGVGGYLLWRGSRAAGSVVDAAKSAAWAINPLNDDNVFAESVNRLGAGLVSDPAGPGKNADGSWTLGGWFYDVTHPDTYSAIRNIGQPTSISSGLTAAQADAARDAYAARDPRRVDLPAFIYPNP